MITVKELIIKLQQIPPETLCHGYEGEECGLTLIDPSGKEYVGFIVIIL
jgi:hypothetical protein